MTLEQIATLLNDTLVPNILGAEADPIAPDLNNVIDLGTKIADIDGDTLKNYTKDFALGVIRTYFDTKAYQKVSPDIYIDSIDYGGAIQRVKARLAQASTSPIYTLQNGTRYDQDTYHEMEMNVKLYTKSTIFRLEFSIPNQKWVKAFTGPEGVQGIVSLIYSIIDRTLTNEIYALTMSMFNYLGVKSAAREIGLVTLYNQTMSPATPLTAATALHDFDFLQFAAEQIMLVRDYVRDMNTKYNDGEVENFTAEEDLRVTVLNMFDKAMIAKLRANTYHDNLLNVGRYSTVNSWMGTGTDLLPTLAVVGKMAAVTTPADPESGTEEVVTTLNNVIGLVYDRYTLGITSTPLPTRSHYNANGDFTNYFMDRQADYYIDTRETAVVLTLN